MYDDDFDPMDYGPDPYEQTEEPDYRDDEPDVDELTENEDFEQADEYFGDGSGE